MAFGWAGAAAGAEQATRQRALDTSTLEDQLAEREYKKQLILNEQARQAQQQQEWDAKARQVQNQQSALDEAARAAGDPLKAAAIKAGILTGAAILPATPKPEEPFTLGPGQMRYGPDGKLIAQGVTPAPAGPLAGFTLSPGQTRYGPDGKPIASSAPKPVAAPKTASGAAGANAPTAYEAERVARTRQSIAELKGHVSNFTTGFGHALAAIPGTPARNFAAQLETLKANIAFNELAQMRQASRTGGALGQISDREETLLSSVLGALDPGQSPENIAAQLQKIDDSLARWQNAVATGGGTPANTAAPTQTNRVKSITEIK